VSFAEPLGIPADADDGFGTADTIVAKGSELIVIDLKTGRGVDVSAEDNPQLKCYALGALELLNGLAGDFDTVRQYLDGIENLYPIGRNGMHKYNNSDHSMLTAMTAVDNIIAGRRDKANLWAINTEMEYHESK
jgi:hypothetical protein